MTNALFALLCCCGSDPYDPPEYDDPIPCPEVNKSGCPTTINCSGATIVCPTLGAWQASYLAGGTLDVCGPVGIPAFSFNPNYAGTGLVATHTFTNDMPSGYPTGKIIDSAVSIFNGATIYHFVKTAKLFCPTTGAQYVNIVFEGGIFLPTDGTGTFNREDSWSTQLFLRTNPGCYKGFYASNPNIYSGVDVPTGVCQQAQTVLQAWIDSAIGSLDAAQDWIAQAIFTAEATLA